MALSAVATMKAAEYLAAERLALTKHEFVNGQVYAMAGGSPAHARISVNVLVSLSTRLTESPCEPFGSDLRVRVSPTGMYTYPDVFVVSGELQFDDEVGDTVTNPVLIVEVLSPTTEAYDRGAKFAHYEAIETLQSYLLVSQDTVWIQQFERKGGGTWALTSYHDLADLLVLPSLKCEIPVRDIHNRVNVPEGLPPFKVEPPKG